MHFVNLAIYYCVLAANYHEYETLTAGKNVVFHGKFKRHSVTVRYMSSVNLYIFESVCING